VYRWRLVVAGLGDGPVCITVVGGCTGFFLEILVLAPGMPGLRAALAFSLAPGEPLRSALLRSRRAMFRSLVPTRGDVEAPALRLSRIDLPTRMFSELPAPAVGLRVADFREAEIDGVLPLIELPMREVRPDELPTLEILPELAAGCLAPVGVEGLRAPVELPIRDLNVLSCDLDRLLELAAGCLAAVEADDLSVRIELPIRDVLLELTRLRALGADRLSDEDTDGILVLRELPILDLVLVVGRLRDEETDGLLVVMELPMRDLLLGLIRVLRLLLTEVEPVELLPIETLDEGLRELEGLVTVIRLDAEPLGRRLDEIELDRLGVDLLIDTLLELLRLGTDLLDEIEMDRLGVDLLIDILLELLRLGVDLLTDILDELLLRLGTDRLGLRLADIELDRLGVDLLTDVLLELLLVGVDLLVDVLLELLRVGVDRLRLADIELDRLGVGARLTDDLLGLLRVGVGALVGAGALAACVVELELRELELFRELLAARAESAAKATSRTPRINRKWHISHLNRLRKGFDRFLRAWKLELSLSVSMIASFLHQFYKRASAPHVTGINQSPGNKYCGRCKSFFDFFRSFSSLDASLNNSPESSRQY